MVKNLIPAGSCALFLTGCVNLLAQKPDPATAVDAVKFTDQYMEAVEGGLVNPYRLTEEWFKDHGTFLSYSRRICANQDDIRAYRDEIIQICENKNGRFRGLDGWCREKNTDRPLFYAASSSGNVPCTPSAFYHYMTALVYGPKAGVSADEWNAAARRLNFRTIPELEAAEAKEREERRRAQEAERLKQEAQRQRRARMNQMILSGYKGMKLRRQIKLGMICEGYLEEVGVNRVKIYVQF